MLSSLSSKSSKPPRTCNITLLIVAFCFKVFYVVLLELCIYHFLFKIYTITTKYETISMLYLNVYNLIYQYFVGVSCKRIVEDIPYTTDAAEGCHSNKPNISAPHHEGHLTQQAVTNFREEMQTLF